MKKFNKFDSECMALAIDEARKAFNCGEVPVGALLTINDKIISSAYNKIEQNKDATSHAEIICIRESAKILGDWRLSSSTLYVTLEPCCMCVGAAILSRVKKIIWGCPDNRHGACGSWINIFKNEHQIHKVEVLSGLMEEESKELMRSFFKMRRMDKKHKKIIQ